MKPDGRATRALSAEQILLATTCEPLVWVGRNGGRIEFNSAIKDPEKYPWDFPYVVYRGTEYENPFVLDTGPFVLNSVDRLRYFRTAETMLAFWRTLTSGVTP